MISNIIKSFTGNYNALEIDEELRMINKGLPIMIDKETRVDSISIENEEIYYNYTLVNLNAENLNVSNLASKMDPKIKLNACSTSETRDWLNNNNKIAYVYRDKAGKLILKIVADKRDCP